MSIYDKIGCVSLTITILCAAPFVFASSVSAEDKPAAEKKVKKTKTPKKEYQEKVDETKFRYTRPKNAVDGC